MLAQMDQFQVDKTYVFQCRTGGRSIIAASIVERAGVKNVINMAGGIESWKQAMLPVVEETSQPIG
jgi:hydroxyacylglutathione hydrolase